MTDQKQNTKLYKKESEIEVNKWTETL